MDSNESILEETTNLSQTDIKTKISFKNQELQKQQSDKRMNLVLGIFFLIITALLLFLFFHYKLGNSFSILSILTYMGLTISGLFGIVGTTLFFDETKIKLTKQDILYLEDDLELFETKSLNLEAKSDKQFRLNQRELKRYYDLNLSQTKFLCTFGIFLMIIGLLIICATLYIYVVSSESSNTLLLIGCISGILVDFIGAVFITSYTKSVDTAIHFHSKLADSNNLLLANAIACKISQEELRNLTLSEISKNISIIQKENKNSN